MEGFHSGSSLIDGAGSGTVFFRGFRFYNAHGLSR